jgi:hypothetical protein
MEIPETVFEIIFNIVRQQNERLLREIAIREDIPLSELLKRYRPTRKHFRDFVRSVSSGG